MERYMEERPAENESEALKSLTPGFIVQPRYRSSVGFSSPLELRVITLWGKARLGVWWWGRNTKAGEAPHRNTWIVRKPVRQEEAKWSRQFSNQDCWEVVHEHQGGNPGFDKAIELFKRHI